LFTTRLSSKLPIVANDQFQWLIKIVTFKWFTRPSFIPRPFNMPEPVKDLIGENAKVAYPYGSHEAAKMEAGEPRKNVENRGAVEESKPPGDVELPKPLVVQK